MLRFSAGLLAGFAVLTSVSGGVLSAHAAGVTLTISRWAGPQADAQKKLIDDYAKQSGDTINVDAIDYGELEAEADAQHEHQDRGVRPDLRA